jgi:hypothetical protein
MQEYMAGVIPLMPTHIMRSKQRASQRQLARHALGHLTLTDKDGKIAIQVPPLRARLYDHEQALTDREDNGRIDISDIANKRRHAMSHYLLRRGWKRTSTPWVYERINNAD